VVIAAAMLCCFGCHADMLYSSVASYQQVIAVLLSVVINVTFKLQCSLYFGNVIGLEFVSHKVWALCRIAV